VINARHKIRRSSFLRVANGATNCAPTTDLLYHQEYDLIRILLHYGLLYMPSETIEIDDEGKEQLVEVEIPVVQLIATGN
jgi:hypothetical protein